jgi:hypothetical protein
LIRAIARTDIAPRETDAASTGKSGGFRCYAQRYVALQKSMASSGDAQLAGLCFEAVRVWPNATIIVPVGGPPAFSRALSSLF